MRKVHELRSQGITILFVSHDVGDVKAIGDQAMWLDHGKLRALGDPEKVVAQYLAAMTEKDAKYLNLMHRDTPDRPAGPYQAPEIVTTIQNIDHRWGDGAGRNSWHCRPGSSTALPLPLLQPDSQIIVRISVRAIDEHPCSAVIGFMVRNHLGLDFAGTNTAREDIDCPGHGAGRHIHGRFPLESAALIPVGLFVFARHRRRNSARLPDCDWIDNAITLQMSATDSRCTGTCICPAASN